MPKLCYTKNVVFKSFPAANYLSRLMIKSTKWLYAQRRLRSAWVSAQSDQSSLSAWRKLGSLVTHWVHSEDSDQTGRIPRLIWVFAGRTCPFVGFVMRWLIYKNVHILEELFIMPPTSKKLRRHIGLGLSMRQWVGRTLHTVKNG